jgi:hypothetical protein
MSFVAGVLLCHLPEGDAFGCLAVLMQDRGLRRYYSPDMALLQVGGPGGGEALGWYWEGALLRGGSGRLRAACFVVSSGRKRWLGRQTKPRVAAARAQTHLWQLGRLLPPRLAAHLEGVGVTPSLYAASWLMTCFASDFPLGFAARCALRTRFSRPCSAARIAPHPQPLSSTHTPKNMYQPPTSPTAPASWTSC